METCPECGKPSKDGMLCIRCSNEMKEIVEKLKDIIIKICANCNSYFYKNKWMRFENLESTVIKIIKNKIKNKAINLEITPLFPEFEPLEGAKVEFEIEIKAEKGGIKAEYFIPAKLDLRRCDKCAKGRSSYFEGVLQLRNPKEDIINFIIHEVNSRNGVRITKEEKMKNGVDLYISSQGFIQNLGKKLHQRFGGELKVNPRLFSRDRQTSKDIYRVNVLFKAPEFSKGDILAVDDKIIRITDFTKKISGIDLSDNKKVLIDYKTSKPELLQTSETVISKVFPNVEVLHPETYQPIKVENTQLRKLKNGEKVKIVLYKDKVWLA